MPAQFRTRNGALRSNTGLLSVQSRALFCSCRGPTRRVRPQCARIVDGLRAINTKIVRLSASVEELAAAADGIEALSAALDARSRRAARWRPFAIGSTAREPNSVMPFNPATGAFNPMAPKLAMKLESDKLVAEFAFPSKLRECLRIRCRAACVAACFDQLLAFARHGPRQDRGRRSR